MDKTAESVAKFFYDDIICRHGCPEIQISDQGREFVNKLSDELFRLTGTQQRVTSPVAPTGFPRTSAVIIIGPPNLFWSTPIFI